MSTDNGFAGWVQRRASRRVLWLIITLSVVLAITFLVTTSLLFQTLQESNMIRLRQHAALVANMIDSVARFDALHSQKDHPMGSAGATISQVQDSFNALESYSGDMYLVQRKDGHFQVVAANNPYRLQAIFPVESPEAAPFRAALEGKSGVVTHRNAFGVDVLCAYQPVSQLKLGLVAELSIAEIRAPVYYAALIGFVIALVLAVTGSYLFIKLTHPLLDELRIHTAAHRAKSEFLAMMSHEIRTPLNALVGLIQLIGGTESHAKRAGYLRQMETAGSTLQGLVNDILDFSKIEAGMLSLQKESFRFDVLLETVASQMAVLAREKDIELAFEIDPELPSELSGDAMRLQQVLINLGSNAIKFTDRGEVVLGVHMKSREAQSATIEFSMRDTGVGIEPRDLARLFTKFTQVDSSTTRRHGGTGLGLAISKQLVEMMGGSLEVTSTPGKGSRFFFTLTLPAHELRISDRFAMPSALRGARVLVVDDMEISRDILVSLLTAFGCRPVTAENGTSAIQLWRESAADPFWLALVDWRLPDIDGVSVIRTLRSGEGAPAPKRCILITAYEKELADLESSHVDALLTKPVNPSVLFDALLDTRERTKSHAFSVPVGGGKPLLVAEDHPINQQILKELLERAGFTVDVAGDGEHAVEAVRAKNYAAVLMDVHMPRMDGLAAAHAIRALPGKEALPIIAVTADTTAHSMEACRRAGMNDLIAKPIDFKQLMKALVDFVHEDAIAQPATNVGAVLDRNAGTARTGGNAKLYESLLKRFFEQYADMAARMRSAIAEDRLEDCTEDVHALKGVAGNLGFDRLTSAANHLHQALRAGQASADLMKLVEQLDAELKTAESAACAESKGV